MLSGGGARGAYEAGVLHYLRSQAETDPVFARRFDIITGASVGAINACFMASTAHNVKYQARRIFEIWRELKQENIYKRDVSTLAKFMSRSLTAIVRNLFRKQGSIREFHNNQKHFTGLFNTAPLFQFLQNVIPWKQIPLNLEQGCLDALCLSTTQVTSGNIELFIEKKNSITYTGHYVWHDTKIAAAHAIASAAIPLIFPTVKIGNFHYMDGGLRQNTPLSPAIQLHADKILVIGPHDRTESALPSHDKKVKLKWRLESYLADAAKNQIDNAEIQTAAEADPSLGLVFGKVLNSIFLDKLDYDIEQMERINRIIEWGEGRFGKTFLNEINQHIAEKNITGDIANRGLKRLEVLEISPSTDIRTIFAESVDRKDFFKTELTSFEKTLLKILDVDLSTGKDFLSFILFYPQYLEKLLELGYNDAKARHEDLRKFLTPARV